ncbi:hypothetical protein [Pleionea sp. CnH1-48]|uniref:hypothetical protein n=1 Tax=Pleionea sp. CnH1-48 TaxID=2954494 RepID=UPI0020984036|nr:hypothetical protein [Pleionea sp. CnH1-48]MCO7223053.1 hypothetical protein [Pleionea sp. CnH1-48]
MSRIKLGEQGCSLAKELEIQVSTYHAKSWQNEALFYESFRIKSMASQLLSGCELTYCVNIEELTRDLKAINNDIVDSLVDQIQTFILEYKKEREFHQST